MHFVFKIIKKKIPRTFRAQTLLNLTFNVSPKTDILIKKKVSNNIPPSDSNIPKLFTLPLYCNSFISPFEQYLTPLGYSPVKHEHTKHFFASSKLLSDRNQFKNSKQTNSGIFSFCGNFKLHTQNYLVFFISFVFSASFVQPTILELKKKITTYQSDIRFKS